MTALLARWAPWLAGAVLIAGVAAYGATRIGGGSGPKTATAPPHRHSKLVAAERRVALEFIDTAVARRAPVRAWDLVAPELKRGTTLADWRKGTIPVIPYPVQKASVLLRVVDSFSDMARLTATFVPHTGSGATPESFTLDLRKVDGRWLVSAWQPTPTIKPRKGK